MVCLAGYTLPCTPKCTGMGGTTPEMMWKKNICHITLNMMTKKLRRTDMERESSQNKKKNMFFLLIMQGGSATYAYLMIQLNAESLYNDGSTYMNV